MTSISREVYRINPGSMKSLRITKETLEEPGQGEVRVSLKAIGLNFADVFSVWKLYSAIPKGPFIPGLEYSGIVESVGAGASQFKPGDRVMGICRFGAYSSHLNIDERYLVALADTWTYSEGAAYLVQSLTAYYVQIVHKISFLEDTIDKMLLLDSDFVECLLSSAIIKELEVSKKWENEKYKMVQMKLGTRM